MMRAAVPAVLLMMWAACASDPPLAATPLAEVCGAPGPFHLLPLAADERVGSDSRSFIVVDDRLLFVAGQGPRYLSPGSGPLPTTTTVYAVGPCGEDPVVVGHDIGGLRVEPRWPGVALGCTLKGYDLVRLDLSGVAAPVVLASGACAAKVTEHGLLGYEPTDGSLLAADLRPFVDAAAPSFGPAIRIGNPVPFVNSQTGAITLRGDEVLMLEAGGDLVRYGLPDLTKTLLQRGVVTFESSEDGRHLLYQLLPAAGDDPHDPIGTINILDRDSGVSMPVGTGALASSRSFLDPSFASVELSEPDERLRMVSLPGFEFFDMPEGHHIKARLADGRWLTWAGISGPWYLVDPKDGSATQVSDRKGRVRGHSGRSIDLLVGAGRPQKTRPLVRYFFDGRAPQKLAERANEDAVVWDDGRVLTLVAVDDTWLGELTLVEPSTQTVTRIDDHVIAWMDLDRWRHPVEPDTMIYGVVDGERTGVWLARPGPVE